MKSNISSIQEEHANDNVRSPSFQDLRIDGDICQKKHKGMFDPSLKKGSEILSEHSQTTESTCLSRAKPSEQQTSEKLMQYRDTSDGLNQIRERQVKSDEQKYTYVKAFSKLPGEEGAQKPQAEEIERIIQIPSQGGLYSDALRNEKLEEKQNVLHIDGRNDCFETEKNNCLRESKEIDTKKKKNQTLIECCKIHSGEILKAFCFRCTEMICDSCIDIHSGHEVKNKENAYSQCKTITENSLKQLNVHIESLLVNSDELSNTKNEIIETFQQQMHEIQRSSLSLITSIEGKAVELLKLCSVVFTETHEHIIREQNRIRQNITQLIAAHRNIEKSISLNDAYLTCRDQKLHIDEIHHIIANSIYSPKIRAFSNSNRLDLDESLVLLRVDSLFEAPKSFLNSLSLNQPSYSLSHQNDSQSVQNRINLQENPSSSHVKTGNLLNLNLPICRNRNSINLLPKQTEHITSSNKKIDFLHKNAASTRSSLNEQYTYLNNLFDLKTFERQQKISDSRLQQNKTYHLSLDKTSSPPQVKSFLERKSQSRHQQESFNSQMNSPIKQNLRNIWRHSSPPSSSTMNIPRQSFKFGCRHFRTKSCLQSGSGINHLEKLLDSPKKLNHFDLFQRNSKFNEGLIKINNDINSLFE